MNGRNLKQQITMLLIAVTSIPILLITLALVYANWQNMPTVGVYIFIGIGLLGSAILLYHAARHFLAIKAMHQQLRLETQKQTHEITLAKKKTQADIDARNTELYLQRYKLQSELAIQKEREDRQHQLALEQLVLQRQRQTVELSLQQAQFHLDQHLALTRVQPETYVLNLEPGSTITPLASLKRPAPEDKEKTASFLLDSPQQPQQDFLLSHLRENSFTVSPGTRAANGEVVFVDLLAVPHLKIIGSTGFGKSCLAGAILDQAIHTHSPRVLQLALLDLEHKTSRLFEDAPHVATLQAGRRQVQMVATNPDEVAIHLGILKGELDRRTKLSDAELTKQPVLLLYVEEMLSLQYEVIDPKLLTLIFQSLTILSIRGRKYGMFLLACMQTDYSTDELKVSQKMFRFRSAAGIDTSAARAAGFMNTELIKHNFQQGKPGQFVVEYPSFSDVVLAPIYNVKQKIAQKTGFLDGFGQAENRETPEKIPALQGGRKEAAREAKTDALPIASTPETNRAAVRQLRAKNWGKGAIIEKVWGCKPGSSKAYKQAEEEYNQIIQNLTQEISA